MSDEDALALAVEFLAGRAAAVESPPGVSAGVLPPSSLAAPGGRAAPEVESRAPGSGRLAATPGARSLAQAIDELVELDRLGIPSCGCCGPLARRLP